MSGGGATRILASEDRSSSDFRALLERARDAHDAEVRDLRRQAEALREELFAARAAEAPAPSTPESGTPSEELSVVEAPRKPASMEPHDRSPSSACSWTPWGRPRPPSPEPPGLEPPVSPTGKEVEATSSMCSSPTHSRSTRRSNTGLISHEKQRAMRRELRHEKGVLHWFVRSPQFEGVVGVIIFLNAITMALELQYLGFSLAEDSGHRSSSGDSDEVWPYADQVFSATFWVFGVLFTLEVAIKILALRLEFATDWWNWLDLSVVAVWLCSHITYVGVNMQFLRILRVARTLRLLRLLKIMNEHMTDSLFLFSTALSASLGTTAVSCLAILAAHSFCALLLCGSLFEFYFSSDPDEAQNQTQVFEYFGSFSRAFLSVMEISLGNWGVIVRVLTEDVHEALLLYGVIHKLILGFAVIAVLTAVFIQETMKAATMDDNLMSRQAKRMRKYHTEKMTKLLEEGDINGNGSVEKSEWMRVCEDEWVGNWLRAQDIRPADAGSIFDLLDENGDGRLTSDELINGTSSLRGSSAMIYLRKLLHEVHVCVQDVRCHALFEQPAVACERA